MQADISALDQLKKLSLAGNLKLQILPSSVGTMTNLEELDVSRYYHHLQCGVTLAASMHSIARAVSEKLTYMYAHTQREVVTEDVRGV